MSLMDCPECKELFHVIYIGPSAPGGKEREEINCPTCRHTVDTDVTSQVIMTKVLTAEEKARYQSGASR